MKFKEDYLLIISSDEVMKGHVIPTLYLYHYIYVTRSYMSHTY